MRVDDDVVAGGADRTHLAQEAEVAGLGFVPNPNFANKGVVVKKPFIPFAHPHVDGGMRPRVVPRFEEAREQDDVADERGLNEQHRMDHRQAGCGLGGCNLGQVAKIALPFGPWRGGLHWTSERPEPGLR